MKKFKQLAITLLAISICFVFTACSNDTTETSTIDASIETSTPDDISNDTHSTENSEITYEIYFSDLTLFTGNFLALEGSFAQVTQAFADDYENTENVENFVVALKEMNENYAKIDQVRPTKDLEEVHQNLVDSYHTIIETVDSLIVILENDFVNRGQEALDEYNVLFTFDYIDNYNELANNLYVVASELDARMGN